MVKNKLFFLCSLFLLFASCSKLPTTAVESVISLNDFPTKQGTKWEYKLTDLVKNTSDKLTVTILENVVSSDNKSVNIWQYRYSDHTDSLYVSVLSDTISFFYGVVIDGKIVLANEEIKLVFPIKEGNAWDSQMGQTNVNSIEYIPIPINTYELIPTAAFNITQYPSHWANVGGKNQFFISTDLGIIKFDNGIFNTDRPYHTIWELKYFYRG
jgi:hypothetical protein